jgi:NAD+ synthase (glutamine-hydrolysing)
MLDGFIRVAAIAPEIKVADCAWNAEQIEAGVRRAAGMGARIICTPELAITGYTCGDLFLQDALLENAKRALLRLVDGSAGRSEVVITGMPFADNGKLYNVAVVYTDGDILGIVPKTHIPNYGEFYELRHFTPSDGTLSYLTFSLPAENDSAGGGKKPVSSINGGQHVPGTLRIVSRYDTDENALYEGIPFGSSILFRCEEEPEFTFAVEICEDLWVAEPPSVPHACAGAKIIANLSAGNETIGKAAYRRLLVGSQSGRLLCGYLYAGAGSGESTTDMVFSGHILIAENGNILAEAAPFSGDMAITDIDIYGLAHDRRYMNSFQGYDPATEGYETVFFSQNQTAAGSNVIPIKNKNATQFFRHITPLPFVPSNAMERDARCEEILNMQSAALAKRLSHTQSKAAVIGISGGLDSTLALIVTVKAIQRAAMPLSSIVAVTMPAFGTSERTLGNARKLCNALGIGLREIDIKASVKEHLASIGHAAGAHDVVFENAQARIRTLVLMDLANQLSGLVVGTGDLSELALGWATYNGDHMSMYGVNAGVPKTLVRHIIRYAADADADLAAVLGDVLDTPVSPELLPSASGEISQKTEEIIGPYELHDFFLYHVLRWGRRPELIFEMAKYAFSESTLKGETLVQSYDEQSILKWLKLFYRRFFNSQFKRSALPDGPKIGSVSLSPRGDWRMPSDAESAGWLKELENL